MKISSSLEEYLKTIYVLKNTEKEVRVTDIAKKLGISKPSVNKSLNNLKDIKLIKYESYGDIVLTEEGIVTAKDIMKRYSTLKLFLTEVLEVNKDIAEAEAKAMKHAISEDTVKKLEKYINKILDLGDLDCGYDATNPKCLNCVKITAKNRIKKEEEKKQ